MYVILRFFFALPTADWLRNQTKCSRRRSRWAFVFGAHDQPRGPRSFGPRGAGAQLLLARAGELLILPRFTVLPLRVQQSRRVRVAFVPNRRLLFPTNHSHGFVGFQT